MSSDTYARALKTFGESSLVDVVTLMGNYAGTATRLSAFNQQMPPGWKQFRRCRSRRRPIFIRTREAGFR